MARELFVKSKNIESVRSFIKKKHRLPADKFKKELSSYFIEEVKAAVDFPHEYRDSLYLVGSFARNEPSLFSDLDLLLITESKKKPVELLEKLRASIRNFSIKHVCSLEELLEKSDEKGLISCWNMLPLFKAPNIQMQLREHIKEQKLEDIKNFMLQDKLKREKRYGSSPGLIHSNLKYSPGAVIESYQMQFLEEAEKEKNELSRESSPSFLYKLRLLNQFYAGTDNFSLNSIPLFVEAFSFDQEREFLKPFFAELKNNRRLLLEKLSLVEGGFSESFAEWGLSKDEWELYLEERKTIEAFISSPSYHVYEVATHLEHCAKHVVDFIKEYDERFEFTAEEKQILIWAALLHDIKKGEGEQSHSEQGAQFVLEMGERLSWDSKKTSLISWLVGEHLSLSRQAFKSDPYDVKLLQKLALRGLRGRKAVLLFILTLADIKATNPAFLSQWKTSMLEKVLDQILGKEIKIKESLLEETSSEEHQKIIERLQIKELSFVPYPVLKSSFQKKLKGRISLFPFEEQLWLRFYQEKDEPALAQKILRVLYLMGVNVNQAFFKTFKQDSSVYNWFALSSSLSEKAFKVRFDKFYKSSLDELDLSEISFEKIKVRHKDQNYAVISFRGQDQMGVLLKAVEILNSASLNILWGHAVTWGDSIEDLFGVEFKDPQQLKSFSDKYL